MFQYSGMNPTKLLRRLRTLLSTPDTIQSSIELGPEWKEAAKTIAAAKKVAVLTGAGMSAESGIATFRAKEGGVWKQFNPSEVATPTAFKRNPYKVLAWHKSMRSICQSAEPNAGHYAIANLQELFPEVIVITQNIDNLHQRAGSKFVLEMHGHLFRMKGFCDPDIHEQGTPVHCPVCRGCTSSRESWKPEYREAIVEFTEILPGEVPRCPHCSGALRPDIVWFNEGLDPYVLDAAWNIADGCDVLLVIGASLQVQPVSGIPWRAAYKGVKVIEINPEPAEVSGFWSVRIQSSAAVALPLLLKMIEEEYR